MNTIPAPKYREINYEDLRPSSGRPVESLFYEPHVCITPENWREVDKIYDNEGDYPERPRYPEDAIWQCPDCGRFFHYLGSSGLYAGRYWQPVRWWNFRARRHIREVLAA